MKRFATIEKEIIALTKKMGCHPEHCLIHTQAKLMKDALVWVLHRDAADPTSLLLDTEIEHFNKYDHPECPDKCELITAPEMPF